jgi:tetratricopeptide (TPR) repeat protein
VREIPAAGPRGGPRAILAVSGPLRQPPTPAILANRPDLAYIPKINQMPLRSGDTGNTGRPMTENHIDEAISRYESGDFQAALEMLLEILDGWPDEASSNGRQRAQLYLASIYLNRGKQQIALELLNDLEQRSPLDSILRTNLFLDLARLHLARGDQQACLDYLGKAANLIEFNAGPDTVESQLNLASRYHLYCGRYFDSVGSPPKAMDHYRLARDRAASVEHRSLVTNHHSLANGHARLGQQDLARRSLDQTFSALEEQGQPLLGSQVALFASLSAFDLFVCDSKEEAIERLLGISEKVVHDLSDLRRVFDFFGEVLILRHMGRFGREKLKQLIDRHEGDPLIQAYLPTSTAVASRPGEPKATEPARADGEHE